jgi:hypothetical protein
MADMSVVWAAIDISVRIHPTEVQKRRKFISKTICDTTNLLHCVSTQVEVHTMTSSYLQR